MCLHPIQVETDSIHDILFNFHKGFACCNASDGIILRCRTKVVTDPIYVNLYCCHYCYNKLLLPTSLLPNTIQNELTEVFIHFSSDSNCPRLCFVSKLTMVTNNPINYPTIFIQKGNDVSDLIAFHSSPSSHKGIDFYTIIQMSA